jgi:UPF0271 protein
MDRALAIDLNSDLGEDFGVYQLGQDTEMMPWITSANIACGFHAGDPEVMAQTVALAKAHGVAVGAHPGYLDLQGFGRRSMALSSQALTAAVIYQLGALEAFARVQGMALVHVKPHGAMNNLAARDYATAQVIARAVSAYNPNLILVGPAGSELYRAGVDAGLRVAAEGFPDRAYLPDGQLMPRGQAGALIQDSQQVAQNAVRLVQEGLPGHGGVTRVDTLCLHGDNAEAVENARQVRQSLEAAGIAIHSLSEILGS